jgi:anthranilate phosphoribosyltransferase
MEQFATAITKLINKQNLTYEEMSYYFRKLMNNEETEMQQGAFLSALAAKGESPRKSSRLAVYHGSGHRNCGPRSSRRRFGKQRKGMDRLKTFNISSLAALIAAADGVAIARHGARAITSKCGAIDVLEAVGIAVDADAQTVKQSVETAGIGIFNGMSPNIHPFALGRILSQISFGTVLNVAASLANPAKPTLAVRGVYEKGMCLPVAQIMKEIGYRRAFVVCGLDADGVSMIDEASTLGETAYAYLRENGSIEEGTFAPKKWGLTARSPGTLPQWRRWRKNAACFSARADEQSKMRAQTDIVCLNAGLILLVTGHAETIAEGCTLAKEILASGKRNARNTAHMGNGAMRCGASAGGHRKTGCDVTENDSMKLYAVKSGNRYLRWKDGGILAVVMEKASVYPTKEAAAALYERAVAVGLRDVRVVGLQVTEEEENA